MTYREIYDRLRDSAEDKIDKKRKGKIRAVLGYSKCSVSVGANEVLKAMQEVLVEGEIEDVIIETTGCIGLCSKEPLLEIYTKDGDRYTYELVTPKKARAIILSHSLYDEELEEYILKM
ncbi:(2Fe-2S) ferredoxin domain-containing protein [Dethiothermospora halolimnae]|uniref:(2Fe-2S) ferredoxin domain-containing protein n=1 Tax=Dethiothermospora halolimnae TaxID=3114390 RepID=UPI003CCBAF71